MLSRFIFIFGKMRTRKNPCPADKVWPEKHKSQESERETAPTPPEDPDGSQINGICPEESEEFKGDLKKSRNGKKQRKRKRSPKAKSGGADSQLEFLLGMSAERVWFDKPLYDRAESVYRKKIMDSWSGEAPESRGIPEEFPAPPGVKSGPDIPKSKGICSHGNLAACHHVVQGVWLNKPDFDRAEGKFMEKSRFFLLPPDVLSVPARNSGLGTPDEGYGTALPTPATPCLAPLIPDSGIPGVPDEPVNGKPQFSNWEALAAEVWLEKPRYDAAEKNFYERMFSRNIPEKIMEKNQKAGNQSGNGAEPVIPGIPEDIPTCFFLHRDSEAGWLHKSTYDRAESRFFALEASRASGIRESPENPPVPAPATKKMALDHFLHDKVWLDKHKYDDAERRFYERLNGPRGGSNRSQENGASTILRDIARARENIQKSLEGSGGASGATGDQNELLARISHLEVENQNLRSVVSDLQMAIFKLESRLNALEKSSSGSHQPSPVPPTQKVEPFSIPSKKVELPAKKPEPAAAEGEDEDDDIDLFGSDDEQEDREAAKVREERLRQYAEKKAKKPGIIAKSSILLDVKPWDDETDMAKLEECVRSVHMDGLLWGASKLVPVGYGIRKLQIQCVVEDEKVGTDILEEEITKFEDYVQSVDIAAFNKI
ncbi:elongation factor 1-delta isoform X3 [Manacus candei]|uniref:elongation factor 1-delta isoform X3 n=1 Tax=Manacus candei TaxID=415023 RepID=UPI002225DE3E|nr:elongation factor 1-delta isoform X3 [Manacus candei]